MSDSELRQWVLNRYRKNDSARRSLGLPTLAEELAAIEKQDRSRTPSLTILDEACDKDTTEQ